jgi:CRISPR-associated protein Cmr4
MRTIDTWLIQAISNLHAGKGDADFGIVDKHVQRDPVTELPTIFASSIKGALRELFETDSNLKENVNDIFGSDAGGKVHSQGEYRFYDARLLALPVRSSHQFYYLATCPEVIGDFLSDLKRYGYKDFQKAREYLAPLARLKVEEGKPQYTGTDYGDIMLEEFSATKAELPETSVSGFESIILADRFAIFNGNDFSRLCGEIADCSKKLPG